MKLKRGPGRPKKPKSELRRRVVLTLAPENEKWLRAQKGEMSDTIDKLIEKARNAETTG